MDVVVEKERVRRLVVQRPEERLARRGHVAALAPPLVVVGHAADRAARDERARLGGEHRGLELRVVACGREAAAAESVEREAQRVGAALASEVVRNKDVVRLGVYVYMYTYTRYAVVRTSKH